MVWNLCQKITITASVDDTIQILEKNISKCIHELKPFSWAKPYHFRRVKMQNTKFSLAPSFWDRLPSIGGKIIKKENGSQIILKMSPPLWFFITLIVAPTFFIFLPILLYDSQIEGETILPILFFWVLLSSTVTVFNILAVQKMFKKLDKIIRDHN